MKKTQSLFVKNASGILGISIMLMMLLTLGCENDEGPLPDVNESSETILKSATVFNDSYAMSGSTHFPAYAVKEHTVISPWEMNMLTCTAALSVDGQVMTLSTEEYFGTFLMRMIQFEGKLTPGGTVKFDWPDTWWEMGVEKTIDGLADQILEHTGCVIYGPGNGKDEFGLHYKGTFDGEKFYAATHFMGKQVQFGTVPFYSEELLGDLIEGPVQFDFTIELIVSE